MGQQSFKPSLTRATVLRIAAMTMFASILLFEGAEFQRTTLQSVDHASQVIGAGRELLKLSIDMESGLRGFLFTGKPIFLQPYNEAAEVIDAKFVALNKLVSDNPAQQAELASIREIFNQWRLRAKEMIRQRADSSVEDSEEALFSQMLESKASMDILRAKYKALIASEIVLREVRTQRVRKRSVMLSVSCFLFAFVGAGGIWLLFRRQMGDLTKVLQTSMDAERTRDALAIMVAKQEKEDAVANYRGQVEAINRSQMMIEFNMDGTIIQANDNYLRAFDYTGADLKGKSHSIFVTEQDQGSAAYKEFWDNLRAGKFQSGEFKRIGKHHREVWIVANYNPIFDKNGIATKVVKFATDVTARKQAEKDLQEASRKAKVEAEFANQAKSDFLANMSHEIRTPVNAIMGMVHLALRANPDTKQRTYLTKIDTAAQNLLGIMNDILDVSKIEAGKVALERIGFSLDEVLRNVRDIVGEKAAQKNLSLVFSVEPGVPGHLLGDPLRLGQVLINLVNNAVKFTDRGKIMVKVMVSDAEPDGEDQADNDLVRLKFSVSDTGIGMTPPQMANLFQAFNQADTSFTRKYGGTGLGLAISKQLTELMGGSMWLESEFGVGSIFHFTTVFGVATEALSEQVRAPAGGLRSSPVTESQMLDTLDKIFSAGPDGDTTGLESTRANAAGLTGRRVLLVDDNDFNCDIAGELLAELGISFTVATNGRAAVDLVGAQAFDLVLMDIQMPVMDGLTATKLIRADARFRNLPILAMTAHAMSGDREKSLNAGLNDHITKPISFDELTKSLLQWMPTGSARPSERKEPTPLSLPVQDDIPDQLPPFDIPGALLRNHGKPKLIRKLLLAFHDRYANAIFELKRYLDEGKVDEAQRLVHSLKSLAAALEATELAETALAVEKVLCSRQAKDLSLHVDMMAKALAPAIAAASSIVPLNAEPRA